MEKKKIPIGGFNKDSRDSNIDDFAENIKKFGLIEPIRVVKNSENKFEVREGHRRINAFQVLNENNPGQGFNKIDAIIFDNIEEYQKTILLNEDTEEKIQHPDDITGAIIDLYKVRCSVKFVAEQFGLTEAQVKKIIRDAYPKTTFDNNTERE
jgi:ParB-like chromosome segregation protein Spo0J